MKKTILICSGFNLFSCMSNYCRLERIGESERTGNPVNFWLDEHMQPQYWHCAFSKYLKHYKLFNAESPEFPGNLRRAFQALGFEEVDDNFLAKKSYHQSNMTVKEELFRRITSDCVLLTYALTITVTDYFYFNLKLPVSIMNACRCRCSDVTICKLLV